MARRVRDDHPGVPVVPGRGTHLCLLLVRAPGAREEQVRPVAAGGADRQQGPAGQSPFDGALKKFQKPPCGGGSK